MRGQHRAFLSFWSIQLNQEPSARKEVSQLLQGAVRMLPLLGHGIPPFSTLSGYKATSGTLWCTVIVAHFIYTHARNAHICSAFICASGLVLKIYPEAKIGILKQNYKRVVLRYICYGHGAGVPPFCPPHQLRAGASTFPRPVLHSFLLCCTRAGNLRLLPTAPARASFYSEGGTPPKKNVHLPRKVDVTFTNEAQEG
jgi:hypothetical protein